MLSRTFSNLKNKISSFFSSILNLIFGIFSVSQNKTLLNIQIPPPAPRRSPASPTSFPVTDQTVHLMEPFPENFCKGICAPTTNEWSSRYIEKINQQSVVPANRASIIGFNVGNENIGKQTNNSELDLDQFIRDAFYGSSQFHDLQLGNLTIALRNNEGGIAGDDVSASIGHQYLEDLARNGKENMTLNSLFDDSKEFTPQLIDRFDDTKAYRKNISSCLTNDGKKTISTILSAPNNDTLLAIGHLVTARILTQDLSLGKLNHSQGASSIINTILSSFIFLGGPDDTGIVMRSNLLEDAPDTFWSFQKESNEKISMKSRSKLNITLKLSGAGDFSEEDTLALQQSLQTMTLPYYANEFTNHNSISGNSNATTKIKIEAESSKVVDFVEWLLTKPPMVDLNPEQQKETQKEYFTRFFSTYSKLLEDRLTAGTTTHEQYKQSTDQLNAAKSILGKAGLLEEAVTPSSPLPKPSLHA
jgi:hypothetical protein